MMTLDEQMVLTAAITYCASRMRNATREDLPALRTTFEEAIADRAALNAALLWVESIIEQNELTAS